MRPFLKSKSKFLIIAFALVAILLVAGTGIYTNISSSEVESGNPVIADISSVDQLSTRISDIRSLAWQKMDAQRHKGYVPMISVKTLVGPHSLDCAMSVTDVIHGVETLFQNSKLPHSVIVLIGNSELDAKWFVAQSNKLLEPKFRSYIGSEMINPETVNQDGVGILWAEDVCNSSLDLSSNDQVKISHGFFHVLQTLQFLGKEDDWGRWGEVPRWILEGGATFAATYWKQGGELDNYLHRPENAYELYQLGPSFYPDFIKYTPGEKDPWKHTDLWDNYRVYDAGSYICEIMVALKGPQSILDIYGDYLKTQDFDKSFKNIFGTTWNDSYPVISDATYKVIAESLKTTMPYLFPKEKS